MSINDWSRKRIWRFLLIWWVGIIAFCLCQSDLTVIVIPSNALTFMRFFTYIILPRSILELGSSEESFGQSYYQGAILFEFTTAILSLMSLIWCVIDFATDKSSLTQLAAKDWWTAVLVSVVIVFRPAFTYDTSILSNTIDSDGVYFLREGIVIPISYYFFTKLVLDSFLRKRLDKREMEGNHG